MIQLTTNYGVISIELAEDKVPATCANFKSYVESGFFDGTLFHRVIPGFMVQGGGFDLNFEQKETQDQIENEASRGLKNTRGTLAMARTMEPHSATSQFFINVVDNEFLDHTSETMQGWGYCAFATVTDGMDVVDKIVGVETGRRGPHADVPSEDVIIEKAEWIA
ncbi:peptidylprolyl isomerase [Litorivicinus lipolyticus]|uniref:Peptidyl-prolyl cis-trans isomerase n=1 Tax=Litorivicinus lipolyticus TaxID=418701 RepID=A0A5Q2Q870_9GAMM|nr:peptidylprolyl isomerase [Litorivicinus lipolyticus]QGG80308.1 peptidylprolyl isomerase [Litorivicinus lipolyticus]